MINKIAEASWKPRAGNFSSKRSPTIAGQLEPNQNNLVAAIGGMCTAKRCRQKQRSTAISEVSFGSFA